jgi:ketosteroid isomerase-like protein
MESCDRPDLSALSENQLTRIKAEVKKAAIDHLNSKDAVVALSHYTEDVIAVSNTRLFPSYEMLAKEVKAYYRILKEINLAVWDEMHIRVIDANSAIVTAKFRFGFTSTNNEKNDIQGIWTALYVLVNGSWKIRVRHESFASLK